MKYLIEHAIKPTNSKVNEMVFLNEYCSFGILGVDNKEIYTITYLKEEDYPNFVDDSEKEVGTFISVLTRLPRRSIINYCYLPPSGTILIKKLLIIQNSKDF